LPSAHAFLVAFIVRNTGSEPRGYDWQYQRRYTMGDKGGKKDKEKGQKQKSIKQTKDLKEKKDKEPKSALK
jgi:hypothetical protein